MATFSQAEMKGKVAEHGLIDLWPKFESLGWSTMKTFAFATNYTPGAPNEEVFVNNVLKKLFEKTDDPREAAVRYLHFECFTFVSEDLKRRAGTSEEQPRPKKLPVREHEDRLSKMKTAVPTLDLTEEKQPSYALVDKYVAMREVGLLKPLPWSALGRRDDELRGEDNVKDWFDFDPQGSLRRHTVINDTVADIGTDLRLRDALTRRGVALHMAGLMSFGKHEAWVKRLFKMMQRAPRPGYAAISLQQIRDADNEWFVQMADLSRGNLVTCTTEGMPLDKLSEQASDDEQVKSILIFLPARANPQPQAPKRDPPPQAHKAQRPSKKQKTAQKGGGKSGGKGGANKKGKQTSPQMPKELQGMKYMIGQNRICFDFNLDGCLSKATGEPPICGKGFAHVCCRCGKSGHSQRSSRCDMK